MLPASSPQLEFPPQTPLGAGGLPTPSAPTVFPPILCCLDAPRVSPLPRPSQPGAARCRWAVTCGRARDSFRRVLLVVKSLILGQLCPGLKFPLRFIWEKEEKDQVGISLWEAASRPVVGGVRLSAPTGGCECQRSASGTAANWASCVRVLGTRVGAAWSPSCPLCEPARR